MPGDTMSINGTVFGVDTVTMPDGTTGVPVERIKNGWGDDGVYKDVTALTPMPIVDTAALNALNALIAKVSNDPATQTTLAAILTKLSSDPATQTTVAAVLAALQGTLTVGLPTGAATATLQTTAATKLDAIVSGLAAKLQTRSVGVAPPLGYAQATVTGSAVALPNISGSIPAAASTALVTPRAPVRWRDDTTDPTAAIGMYLAADQPLSYQGSLSAFRMIAVTGSVEVNVSYYGVEA